jgi:CRP-like cAMP-binding protein
MHHMDATLATAPTQQDTRNRLLRALPSAEFERLAPYLERVKYSLREVLIDYDAPVEHVHFIESGVISNVSITASGGAVETATVGAEGMIGLPVVLGTDRMASQTFCQVPGAGYCIEADQFRRLMPELPTLSIVLRRYTHALLTLVMQTCGCNAIHLLRERCARWLLLTHDRVGSDSFALTHHFLSQMLGVRRASVTEAAGALQAAGAIRYTHGMVTVIDRTRLEEQACECYAVIAREFSRLLDGRELGDPLRHVQTSHLGRSVLGDGTPPAAGEPAPPDA